MIHVGADEDEAEGEVSHVEEAVAAEWDHNTMHHPLSTVDAAADDTPSYSGFEGRTFVVTIRRMCVVEDRNNVVDDEVDDEALGEVKEVKEEVEEGMLLSSSTSLHHYPLRSITAYHRVNRRREDHSTPARTLSVSPCHSHSFGQEKPDGWAVMSG